MPLGRRLDSTDDAAMLRCWVRPGAGPDLSKPLVPATQVGLRPRAWRAQHETLARIFVRVPGAPVYVGER